MRPRSPFGLGLLLIAGSALAADPTLTFTAATVSGSGSVIPSFTWSTSPAATSCNASGDAAWTGPKPASGTATLAAIASTKTYTLTCTWPADTQATLTWSPATENTDGTPYADAAGYRINYGTTAGSLTQTVTVSSPATTSYVVPALTPATWFFCIQSLNASGVFSDCSATVSKTINAAGPNVTRQIAITVNPKPQPPSSPVVS